MSDEFFPENWDFLYEEMEDEEKAKCQKEEHLERTIVNQNEKKEQTEEAMGSKKEAHLEETTVNQNGKKEQPEEAMGRKKEAHLEETTVNQNEKKEQTEEAMGSKKEAHLEETTVNQNEKKEQSEEAMGSKKKAHLEETTVNQNGKKEQSEEAMGSKKEAHLEETIVNQKKDTKELTEEAMGSKKENTNVEAILSKKESTHQQPKEKESVANKIIKTLYKNFRDTEHKNTDTKRKNYEETAKEVYTSDSDEPLQILQQTLRQKQLHLPIAKRRKRRNVKQKHYTLFESSDEEISDDLVKDPPFKIKKSDIQKSDSDSDLEPLEMKRKRRKEKTDKTVNKAAVNNDSKLKSKPLSERDPKGPQHIANKKNATMQISGTISSIKRKYADIRNTAWKKKASCLSKNKKKCPGRPAQFIRKKGIFSRRQLFTPTKKEKVSSPAKTPLTEARHRSMATFRARQHLYETHSHNLDNILFSNGLERLEIDADGNCFFNALHKSLSQLAEGQVLRRVICDHLETNFNHYNNFLETESDETLTEKEVRFRQKVNYLRDEGHWSSDLADALPLASANALESEIMIFSSDRNRPMIKIQPSLTSIDDEKLITLALIAVPGVEHYDACKALDLNTNTSTKNSGEKATENAKNKLPCATPRKQAQYKSPKKMFRSRKRKANPAVWKKNVRKMQRNSGEQYINSSGKLVRARKVQTYDCTKCRFKCSVRISEQNREELHANYWNLKDYTRQRDYICSTVVEAPPARIKTTTKNMKNRKLSRTFVFKVKNESIRVCKMFYLKTLDIGEKVVQCAMKHNKSGMFTSVDRRGSQAPVNKTPDGSLDFIRKHIESFPIMDPHYTRKDTNRKFLGSELNITKMYRLYREKCQISKMKPVGAAKYRKVFCEEYNYSFHTPKKDQCRHCNLYKQREENGTLTESMIQQYNEHMDRKVKAREEKQFDKDYAKKTASYHTTTFDLQAVLQTPCSKISQAYYKRKLNCFNLSVYSLADGRATCYTWNETEGNRGADEIATAILLYIKSLPPTIKNVCFFSDSCSGQNRNRHMTTALLHGVLTIGQLETINQKYLEPGHTEMECDSMHSAVEAAKKCTAVHVPSQWDTIIRMARKRNPYTVVPLKHGDFLDFKEMSKQTFPSTILDTNGKRVQWLNIKWLQFRKHEPDCVFFKYKFDEDEFKCIRIKHEGKKQTRMRSKEQEEFCIGVTQPKKKFKSKIPITNAKKKDLLDLCHDGTIPEEYLGYYTSLPSSLNAKDKAPEPDLYDEDILSDDEK